MRACWFALAFASLALGCAKPSESTAQLPSFSFIDQRGNPVTRTDLAGHVWIADFMYTSCQSACPLITSRLVTLERRLRAPSLRFVSFSVDPEQDTSEALARYAARWNSDEARWTLLRTTAVGLAALTTNLKLELSRERGEPIHTNRFFLIDTDGKVVGSYDSSDDAALARLIEDASSLLDVPPENGVSGTGRELFAALACNGCHADSQLAPPLTGLFGARVMFERGEAIVADDPYLLESIASPELKQVAGYPSSMPRYGSLLTSAQLESLVSYVKSLTPEPVSRSAAAGASTELDPVCGMSTRVTAQTANAEYQGHRYHFCSASCAARFHAQPTKYVRAP